MDLSIIIAHYDPGNHPNCLLSFHKTLSSILEQKKNLNIEIIVCDDGSINNIDIMNDKTSIIKKSNKSVYYLNNEDLNKWKLKKSFNYPDITTWLYYPKTNQSMCKALLGNVGIEIAQSDNLLFLDDDNYFITNNSIDNIIKLLTQYQLVIGQIKDSNNRLRPYSSHRVQGTTFAVRKSILQKIGGFGEWTEKVSSGVDSDIWWKLYHYFHQNQQLKGCYTSKFITIDSCSKRWKPHIKQLFRHRAVRKEFEIIHGCKNYRNPKYNPSRIKSNWLKNLI